MYNIIYRYVRRCWRGRGGATVAVFPYVGRRERGRGERDHVELLEGLAFCMLSFPTGFMISSFLRILSRLFPGSFIYLSPST